KGHWYERRRYLNHDKTQGSHPMVGDHASVLSEGLRQGLRMPQRAQDAIERTTSVPSLAPASRTK
ncbi:hypothetical protein JZU69_04140, partial [bacterium]|nr:hypothetical protein [bacterium]